MGGKAGYEYNDDAPVGNWGMQYGAEAPRVTLFERDTRGDDIKPPLYARWYVRGRRQGPYKVRRVTTIRDKKGNVHMERRQAAETEAKRIWEAVQEGEDPKVIFAEPEGEDGDDNRTPMGELTIDEGLDLFMDEEEGWYAGKTDGEWFDDQKRRARRLKSLLDSDTRWTDLVPAKVQGLWVKLHDYYEDTETTGRRESIRTVQLLGTARKWLIANGRLVQHAPELSEGWRNALKDFWQSKADETISVSRPSHDEAELRLIVAAVRDETHDIDPRFRALMRMALGQRLGPVGMRALRSNLCLDDSGRWGIGQLTIPSRPGKQGVRLDLSKDLRKMWERLLEDGYLSLLEDAYQEGDIDDYHLLPSGKLKKGIAPVENGAEPVQDRWLNTQLRALERQIYERHPGLDIWSDEQRDAETMHVYGRGWHGLRRGMVELLDKEGVQPSVRNAMLGWVPGSRVPELVYQNRESEQRFRRAAETRESVNDALGGIIPGDDAEDRSRDDVLSELDEAMEAGDRERVRKLSAELDALEGNG